MPSDARPASADLAMLLADPGRVSTVSPTLILALLCQLSSLQTALAARLAEVSSGDPADVQDDVLLDVHEAAKKLSVSSDWLYRRAHRLPFTVRLGRHLRFSRDGLERYIRQRQRT